MNSGKISVLTRTPHLLKELRRILPKISFHEVVIPENDDQLKASEIVIADYDLLGPQIYNLPNAKWVQGTWAGLDALMPYVDPNKPLSFKLTRFSGQHFGHLMCEYVVASIVNYEREFFKVRENQFEQEWIQSGKIREFRSIFDLTVAIMGIGNIGGRIGKFLKALGANVLGYGRRPQMDVEKHSYFSKYYTSDSLAELLKSCDYLVNVMPNTPETKGLLNGDILKNCQERGTIFINIGRGSIISEKYLIKALEEKWIAGAILDVFEEEPLRKESPLWKIPQVFITPHVSGPSRAKDIAAQFQENFQLHEQNLPIPTTVDFSRGY